MKKSRRPKPPLEITPAHLDALAELAAVPYWAFLPISHELLALDKEGLADILRPSIHRRPKAPWRRVRGTRPAEPLQVRITKHGRAVLEEARPEQAERLSA